MHSKISWLRSCGWFLMIAGLLGSAPVQGDVAVPDQPVIQSILLEGTNVVVVAEVPEGVTRITLESRTRLEAGSWIPVATKQLDGQGGEVVFNLPLTASLEVLRVKADAQEALPAAFYQGTNSFNGPLSSYASSYYGPYRNMDFEAGSTLPPSNDSSKTARDVVESDIWKISGNTLYFFNQLRGLQVIDITDPSKPVLKGLLELPAAGEQMYVLNSDTVVLLARKGYQYGWGNPNSESQVLIVKITNGKPSIVSQLPVDGYIQESRLVGTALYIASQSYRPVIEKTESVWEWGSRVSSFDLSDPAVPVAKDSFWYAGYGNVIYATDRFLFVAAYDTSNWRRSLVYCLDISAPDGTMRRLATITPRGQVPDKFKMQVNGTVFTVISQLWDDSRRWLTTLETFSLSDPENPDRLGVLDFVKAQGEQLHATRFDGDRVYVVTFFRIDPLWVVDLSDPAKPAIKGELEVPGWSTYIEPLGNRLVTIGIDNSNSWRVAVSLFNVEDPAQPALISKIPLGENHSWSEATYDEKAFNVMPEDGLILVPYQGDFSNGYASRVQLIDLDLESTSEDALKARGAIEHRFQPRRATMFKDSILSISGKELLSVDASNRDRPVLQAELKLAWTANRIFVEDNYLVTIENGSAWSTEWPAAIRVSSTASPDRILEEYTFSNDMPVIGADVKAGYLYIAQANSNPYVYPVRADDKPSDTPEVKPTPFVVSIFSLSNLPELALAGRTEIGLTNPPGYSLEAVWPKDDVLVWSGGYSSIIYFDTIRLAPVDFAGSMRWYPWYYGANSGRFLAFDVSPASSPRFLSDLNLATNGWWNFSAAIAEDGKIYTSHQASEFLPGIKPPYPVSPTIIYDEKTGGYITNRPPDGVWIQRYFLDVIDYGDPTTPTPRKPANIPGELRGVDREGALLYTVGAHWSADGSTDWAEWLDASAYDGVSASLVDSLALPKDWPHPVLVVGSSIYIGRPSISSTSRLGSLETWILSSAGRFEKKGAKSQASPVNNLKSYGTLLATQHEDGSYELLNATNPADLKTIGMERPDGSIWPDLNRADGSLTEGLWFPLDDYGVWHLPIETSN